MFERSSVSAPRTSTRSLMGWRRAAAVAATAAAVGIAAPGIASAHVTAKPGSASIGGYTDLSFGIPHGCGEDATTKVIIDIPKEFAKVTPHVNPNWSIEREKNGETTTKITYIAKTPLASDQKDVLKLQVKVDEKAGEKEVLVPVHQMCGETTMEWTSEDMESDRPAPRVELVKDESGDAHGHSHGGDHSHGHDHEHAHSEEAGNSHDHGSDHGDHSAESHDAESKAASQGSGSAAALGLSALGALTGTAALLVSLRKKK